eukprot:1221714-Pyramimonas_sp.AAC.1
MLRQDKVCCASLALSRSRAPPRLEHWYQKQWAVRAHTDIFVYDAVLVTAGHASPCGLHPPI